MVAIKWFTCLLVAFLLTFSAGMGLVSAMGSLGLAVEFLVGVALGTGASIVAIEWSDWP